MITITEKEFKQLSDYVKLHFGIHLKPEKQSLVMGRLQQVLQQHQFVTFSAYFEYVAADKSGKALATLIDKMTTNHTYFMREADHFEFFRASVLPYWSQMERDRDLRIWSAGCSSGEEPYTLAMIVDQFFGAEKTSWNTQLLATDLSGHVLEKAINGIYDEEQLASLPATYKLRYFKKVDETKWKVADSLRQDVIFRKFNLMTESFPFRRRFHVIFCRNVMIYFDHSTKMELVQRFYDCTERGGYLFIGHSESLDRDKTGFRYIMPSVYRKD